MRVAFEDIDGADGVGAEEAKGHEAEAEEEDHPVVFFLVGSCESEEDGADEGADYGEDEVEELVFGDAFAALAGDEVGSPVGEVACYAADGDGGYEEREETEAEMDEGPAPGFGQLERC